MGHLALEVADIFRLHGPAWRKAQQGHLGLDQLKVMSAIEQCRTAALGGHSLHCDGCGCEQLSYNSCRNRHCPKCQASAAKRWLQERQADLLPVDYYHVVFTLPEPISAISYYNKAVMYDLLFEIASKTLSTIAADPKHLGAKIGMTLVLHTWGSALTHHPHVHGIVPGGGLSPDGQRWVACKPGFFLSVRVLSRLFRRRFLEELENEHRAGKLQFFGVYGALSDPKVFAKWLEPMRQCEWVVYAKRPFAGPEAVLAYLSRYTHRVAISNSRLISLDERGVTFRWKDYRAKERARQKTMTLSADEFMRRFLLHVLPAGFQRIRHYGLLANGHRQENLTKVRALFNPQNALIVTPTDKTQVPLDPLAPKFVCAHCGAQMRVIDIFCTVKLFARRHTSSAPHDCKHHAIIQTLSALSLARADGRKLGPLVEKYPFQCAAASSVLAFEAHFQSE